MKKLGITLATIVVATVVNAASVGWTLAGATAYANDAYSIFVIGQNGATSIETITALLDAGSSIDSYAFSSGTINASGAATSAATAASAPTLDAGTYEAFFVVFDTVTPTVGESNYAVVSGASGLTKTVGASTSAITFTSGNQATYLNTASNWSSYGSVPEPTSGLLMLLGMAGLALKRKRA